MKKIFKVLGLVFILVIGMIFGYKCYALDSNIILNDPVTDDVAHIFKYPNISINSNIKPYSITLSIENGYFSTVNTELNEDVSIYFDFRGGTNINNDYINNLNTTEKYKLITFNLKKTVDLEDSMVKANVISSIKNFLSDILFYNEENKDAKFTLTFSEVELKLSDTSLGVDDIDIIAFKDPEQAKEHYYARINNNGILWSEAYKVASQLEFNGLQGYLVTITSEAEHNFIY